MCLRVCVNVWVCVQVVCVIDIKWYSPEENVHFVDVAGVQSDWMIGFRVNILEGEEVVWHLWRPGHLTGSL